MIHSVNSVRRLVALTTLLLLPAFLAVAQPSAKSPTDTYLGYRAAMLKAKTLDDLKPWFSKDGVAKLNSMPADQRGMMLEFVKDMSSAITNLKVVKESITGDAAKLQVEGTDVGDKSVKKATVDVVREGGVWKFVKESWGES